MSIKVISMIWDEQNGFLTGIEKAILIRLADFGSDNGMQIYPGKNRLALDTGFCLTTVKKTLNDLQKKKILTIKNRKSKVQNITNLYSINVKLLQKLSTKSPVDKKKIGRAPDALGRAPRDPGGRAPRDPDPLNSNREINNNKTVVVEREIFMKDLLEFGVDERAAKQIASEYSEKIIREKIALGKTQTSIRNPTAWLKQALRQDFKHQPLSNSPQMRSTATVEETAVVLQRVDTMRKQSSRDPSHIQKAKKLVGLIK